MSWNFNRFLSAKSSCLLLFTDVFVICNHSDNIIRVHLFSFELSITKVAF